MRGSRGEIRLYPATREGLADHGANSGLAGRVLTVSASGYHQHRTRSKAPHQPGRIRDMALLVHIRAVFVEMKGAYGWPRIWRELTARGVHAGKERVRKLMKANGLQARGKCQSALNLDPRSARNVDPLVVTGST